MAGVSHQTVSRVLTGFPSISDETRARVVEAVEKVGYRPNIAARALVTKRSGVIGVLVSNFADYGPATSVAEIERACRDAGYRVSVTSVSSSDYDVIRTAVDFLLGQMTDAIVVVTPQRRTFDVFRDVDVHVPWIVLEPTLHDQGMSMACDQEQGVRLATRHLIELGHTGILHVAGPRDSIEADVRMSGFVEEIRSQDLPLLPPVLGDWTSAGGYRIGLSVIDSPEIAFTGVVAANDQTAFGFIHACRARGLRVPEDVSVVGFDDVPESAYFSPELTTVRQDFAEIGRRAIRTLLDRLEGRGAGAAQLLEPRLIVRESTGAAPAV